MYLQFNNIWIYSWIFSFGFYSEKIIYYTPHVGVFKFPNNIKHETVPQLQLHMLYIAVWVKRKLWSVKDVSLWNQRINQPVLVSKEVSHLCRSKLVCVSSHRLHFFYIAAPCLYLELLSSGSWLWSWSLAITKWFFVTVCPREYFFYTC